jgi:hypothetical protein
MAGLNWHEHYPAWSERVHDTARRLCILDGKSPDAVIPEYKEFDFTYADAYLPEAVTLVGPPPNLPPDEMKDLRRRAERYANRTRA